MFKRLFLILAIIILIPIYTYPQDMTAFQIVKKAIHHQNEWDSLSLFVPKNR